MAEKRKNIVSRIAGLITIFVFVTGVYSLPDIKRLFHKSNVPRSSEDEYQKIISPLPDKSREIIKSDRYDKKSIQSLKSSNTEQIKEPQNHSSPSRDLLAAKIDRRRIISDWTTTHSWEKLITGKRVKLFYTSDRENDAAELVYRLDTLGAEVAYAKVSSSDAQTHSHHLYYHYGQLRTAQAIQNMIADVCLVKPRKKESGGTEISLWLN